MASNYTSRLKGYSHRATLWAMRIYPPLLFNRVWALKIEPDFSCAYLKVKKSWLNTNINGTIFGGTISCAADPWHGVLMYQILSRRLNGPVQVWVKSSRFHFRRPASSSLRAEARIRESDIQEVIDGLYAHGKHEIEYEMPFHNRKGEAVAVAWILIHCRWVPQGAEAVMGF